METGFLIIEESDTFRGDVAPTNDKPELARDPICSHDTCTDSISSSLHEPLFDPSQYFHFDSSSSPSASEEFCFSFELDFSTKPPSSTSDAVSILSSLQSYFVKLSSDTKPVHNVFQVNADPPKRDLKGVVVRKKYKKVANRVRPISTALPDKYRIIRNITGDPLADLPTLPTHPPDFTPGTRYTQERHNKYNINPDKFLWTEEEKLGHFLIKAQEAAFAWDESEKGQFNTDYFPPIQIPTIPHTPWVHKNIPILPGILAEVVRIIKDKIAAGTYEPSNSSYRSRWFCVIKKDGLNLHLVHDLQPLNAVTIRDPAVPPMTEQLAKSFGGHSCYGTLDLFVSFDQRLVHPDSHDYMTFQSPLGTLRLTSIAMGYTNSPQIMHGDTTYILRDEIPHVTIPFMDDIPLKGPPTRYKLPDGGYEMIPENNGIRRFVWEYFQGVNRVLQRFRYIGGTFNGKKLELCRPSMVVVGHTCTYEG